MDTSGNTQSSINTTTGLDSEGYKAVNSFQQPLIGKAIEWLVGNFNFYRQPRPGLYLGPGNGSSAALVSAAAEKQALGLLAVNGEVINQQAQLLWDQATKKSSFGKPFASKMELDLWGNDVVLIDSLEVPENYEQLWYLYNYVLYPRFLAGKPTVVISRHSFNEYLSLAHSKHKGAQNETNTEDLSWLMQASLVDSDDCTYLAGLDLPPMLKPEIALYKTLKERGIEPKPQYVVGEMMLDLAVIEGKNKLAIQSNGITTVDAYKNRSQETQISHILFSQGWQILKFSSQEISQNLSQCADAIEELFAGGTKKTIAGRWVVAQKQDVAEELPDNDDEMQVQAAASGGGPVVVTGGAGTGKTNCLIRRAAHLIIRGINPEKILVLAQSTDALELFKQKLETESGRQTAQQLSCFVFDDIGLRIIKDHLALLHRRGPVKIDTAPYHTIARVLNKYRKDLDTLTNQQTSTIDEFVLARQFALYKRTLTSVQQVKANAKDEAASLIANVFQGYEDELRKANRIDAEDRVALAAQLLLQHPQLKQEYQAQYEFVLVDEYQDITQAQDILLRVFAGPANNFMLAGEIDEALSRSTGGCSGLLNSISFRIPQTHCFRLEKNWRLHPAVVRSALRVTARLPDCNDNKLGVPVKTAATATTIQTPTKFSDENAEVEWVAQQCRKLIGGGWEPGQIGVLYQEPRYGGLLEEAITAAGIRCEAPDSACDLVPDEVQDMLSFLKLVVDPDGPRTKDAFERICQLCVKETDPKLSGIIAAFAAQNNLSYLKAVEIYSEATADKSCKELEQLVRMIRRLHHDKLPPAEVILLIGRAYRLQQYYQSVRVPEGTVYEPLRRLKRLQESAYKFSSLEEFVRYQESLKEGARLDGVDKAGQLLNIMTISSARGREFPIVFVAGMADGILPARAAENMDEQRRLCYVALTRAKEMLFLSYPEKFNGVAVAPSPFLTDAGLIQVEPYAKLQKSRAPVADSQPATPPAAKPVAQPAAQSTAKPTAQPAAQPVTKPPLSVSTTTPNSAATPAPAQLPIPAEISPPAPISAPAPLPAVAPVQQAPATIQPTPATAPTQSVPSAPSVASAAPPTPSTAQKSSIPHVQYKSKTTIPAPRQCANCKMVLEPEARFCGECGFVVKATPAATTTTTSPLSVLPACYTCGSLLEDGARFCGQCGTSIAA